MIIYILHKIKYRGVAMVEYAVLLAFVCVVSAVFLDDGVLTGNITNIISKVNKYFDGEIAAEKDEPVVNLFAGNLLASFNSNIEANGAYGHQTEDKTYAFQTAISDANKKPFTLDINSTYKITIDPSVFGEEQQDYRFTLKLFAETGSGYEKVHDDAGIRLSDKVLSDVDQKRFITENSKKYNYSIDRQYNADNTITYTVKTGDTPIKLAAQVYNTGIYRNNIKQESVQEFVDTFVMTKK